MGRQRVCRGKVTQGHKPEWRPLLDTVGEEVTGDFMWMFEVGLSDGTPLQAYKHVESRCYIHLAPDGATFVFEPPDRYRSVPTADVLAAVFAPLIRLADVTDQQITASWARVDWLSRG